MKSSVIRSTSSGVGTEVSIPDGRLIWKQGSGRTTQGPEPSMKSRRPVELVYFETYATKSEALKRECAIKKLKRKEKLALIQNAYINY